MPVSLGRGSLPDTPRVLCVHLYLLVHVPTWVLAAALTPPPTPGLCSFSLALWLPSPHFLGLCAFPRSLLPSPPASVCVFPCTVTGPPPHPLHSARLEENIQTLQHQQPKFILRQLWPGGKAKEKSGRGEEERVPESGRHGVGRRESRREEGFRAGLEPCTWQASSDGFRMGASRTKAD